MALHFLADDEHNVTNARLGAPWNEVGIPPGMEQHTWENITELPATIAPHCYWKKLGADLVFVHPAETPNPYAYKEKQRRVFDWARAQLTHTFTHFAGHERTRLHCQIFQAFVAMNVMAAMHPVNILGSHWSKVEGNLVDNWLDFVEGIRESDWVARPGVPTAAAGGINYTAIAQATGGFVTLDENWHPRQDFNDTGWAVFDREYGGGGPTEAGDIRRATNIVVVPPAAIPPWTASSLEPVERLFSWPPAAQARYLRAVAEIVALPVLIEVG